jgi:phosphonate transport system substrate-binding protein
MEENMNIWNKTSRMAAGALAASIAFTGFLQAQECKNPEVIRFSMIPTEETTQ